MSSARSTNSKLGQRPVVVVADPELNQTILRNRPKLYRRLGTIEPVFQEMGITGFFRRKARIGNGSGE